MTSKKPKVIQMLTSSSRKELPENHTTGGVEPIEAKAAGHHRAQQSMDNSTMPFKVSGANLR